MSYLFFMLGFIASFGIYRLIYIKSKFDYKKTAIYSGVALIICLLITTIIHLSTSTNGFVIFMICFLISFLALFLQSKKKEKRFTLPQIVLLLLTVICSFEIFAYNYDAFENKINGTSELIITSAQLSNNKDVTLTKVIKNEDDTLGVSHSSIIIIKNINYKVRSVYLDIRGNNVLQSVRVSFKDETYANNYITSAIDPNNVNWINPQVPSSLKIDVRSHGEMHELKIEFFDVANDLKGIIFNKTTNINFNILRITIFFSICIAFYLILKYKIYNKEFSFKKFNHKFDLILFGMIVIALMLFVIVSINDKKVYFIQYPFNIDSHLDSQYIYAMQFDAFLKGQFHLDYLPAEALTKLVNPYDITSRNGIFYLWDRAYYNGQYFTYFGISPILLFYYPIYYISGGTLIPSNAFCQGFMAIIGFGFSILLAKELANFYKKRINLAALVLSSLVLIGCSGFILSFWAQKVIYNIPVTFSIVFIMMFLYFSFKTYNIKKLKYRSVLMFLSAFSFIFIILSRPNMVIMALAVIPIFLRMLLKKENSIKNKIMSLIPFAIFGVVLIVGFTGIFYYNYSRFNSIFEFGTSYQLTVNDIRTNTVSIDRLPAALYHFIFQPLGVSQLYPFVRPQYSNIGAYYGYLYMDATFGILMIPIFLLIFYAFKKNKKLTLEYKTTKILIFISIFIVAFLSFCLAGVKERYTIDLMIIPAVLIPFIIYELFDVEDKRKVFIRISALVVVSLFIVLNIAGYHEITKVNELDPTFILKLREFFKIF